MNNEFEQIGDNAIVTTLLSTFVTSQPERNPGQDVLSTHRDLSPLSPGL
jgi:hypothetical protein